MSSNFLAPDLSLKIARGVRTTAENTPYPMAFSSPSNRVFRMSLPFSVLEQSTGSVRCCPVFSTQPIFSAIMLNQRRTMMHVITHWRQPICRWDKFWYDTFHIWDYHMQKFGSATFNTMCTGCDPKYYPRTHERRLRFYPAPWRRVWNRSPPKVFLI